MQKIRVGVLRGGPSSEYDVSLQTGASVLRNLSEEKYAPLDILIDKGGIWYFRGAPVEPERILRQLDVVFIALHGEYGEDGTLQNRLDCFGVPYTGSRALPSSVAMNKARTKQILAGLGIRMAPHVLIEPGVGLEDRIYEVYKTFPQPIVVKPNSRGSSIGVTIARGYDALLEGVQKAFSSAPEVLLEEYIPGREATAGVIEGFRGETIYRLLPIEIIPPEARPFFDYGAKYSGETVELCPGNFTKDEKEEIQRLAAVVHEHIGLRHYSRSDFRVTPEGIYFLEVNTLPGLTNESLLPKSLAAVGVTYPAFLDHLIDLAISGA